MIRRRGRDKRTWEDLAEQRKKYRYWGLAAEAPISPEARDQTEINKCHFPLVVTEKNY